MATKSEFVTSVKRPSHLTIPSSNQPLVNDKDIFCPLEVFKFVHASKFYRAMRVL